MGSKTLCLFNVDKVVVNIDVLISHVMERGKKERKDAAFVGKGRELLRFDVCLGVTRY